MARKSINDMSGIASAIARSSPKAKDGQTKQTAPALGALQGSLTAIREIDPDLIDDWGPKDRLDGFTAVNSDEDSDGFEALKASIAEDGQHVPILVRKADQDGRYQAIYGRRRLQACRELGIKVKANVQEIDDTQALLAKGLENAARRNLSFYEKARFAVAIKEAGHSSATIRKVLSLTAPGLSHLTKVTQNVPWKVGNRIGPAPKSGRPKWTALAEMFQNKTLGRVAALNFLDALPKDTPSDDRLELLLKSTTKRGARETRSAAASPLPGVTLKRSQSSVSLTFKRGGENAAFTDWFDANADDILRRAYAEFTAVNSQKTQSRKE